MSPLLSSHPKEEDEVRLCAFACAECFAGDECLVQVWLYLPEQAEEVKQRAQDADVEALRRDESHVEVAVSRGERLLVTLSARGLEIDVPTAKLTWDGLPARAYFTVGVPLESRPSMKNVSATLIRENVPVGLLMFALKVKAEEEVKIKEKVNVTTQAYVRPRTAYVCYASEDRAEVAKRVQMLRAQDIECFMDVLTLKPDQKWENVFYSLIDQADVFYLFWSEAAARSPHVAREAAYALIHKATHGRPSKIVPLALGGLRTPVPAWLEELHFNDPLLYLGKAEDEAKKK